MKLIIVDEISMVSSLTLAYMHLRQKELFGGEEWLKTVFTCTTHFIVVGVDIEHVHILVDHVTINQLARETC